MVSFSVIMASSTKEKAGETTEPFVTATMVEPFKKAGETTVTATMNNRIAEAFKKAGETTSASCECLEKTEVAETMLFMRERARLAFSCFTS